MGLPIAIDHARARRLAARIVGDASAAEDMVQEATLRVLGRQIRPPYFYQALTNICLSELRRRQREQRALEQRGRMPPPNEPHNGVEHVELVDLARRELAELPIRQRTALVLKVWEGMSYQQIGETMGVSESNAATLAHRGLARLRRALDQEET